MKPLFLATVAGVLLAAPFRAQAEQPARPSNPLDPSAPVPALAYDSALSGHVRPNAPAATPDQTWRRANDAVAGNAGGDVPAAAPAAPAPAHGHHHPGAGKQ